MEIKNAKNATNLYKKCVKSEKDVENFESSGIMDGFERRNYELRTNL